MALAVTWDFSVLAPAFGSVATIEEAETVLGCQKAILLLARLLVIDHCSLLHFRPSIFRFSGADFPRPDLHLTGFHLRVF